MSHPRNNSERTQIPILGMESVVENSRIRTSIWMQVREVRDLLQGSVSVPQGHPVIRYSPGLVSGQSASYQLVPWAVRIEEPDDPAAYVLRTLLVSRRPLLKRERQKSLQPHSGRTTRHFSSISSRILSSFPVAFRDLQGLPTALLILRPTDNMS